MNWPPSLAHSPTSSRSITAPVWWTCWEYSTMRRTPSSITWKSEPSRMDDQPGLALSMSVFIDCDWLHYKLFSVCRILAAFSCIVEQKQFNKCHVTFCIQQRFYVDLRVFIAGPSVLWRCWLGSRKGIRPVKNWVVGCWHVYLSGVRCRLAYGPADATATYCLLLQ